MKAWSGDILLPIATMLCVASGLAQQSPSIDKAWDLVAKGQRQQATQLLNEIIRNNPANADARLLLGSILTEAGDRAGSIAQLTEAVHLRPRSAEAQNALGEAYNTFGDWRAAREPFERAAALDPNFAPARTNLGLVLVEAGEFDAAAPHLDRAIALIGMTADAAMPHYLRAKVCTAKGDVLGAAAHLNKAVALRPDFAEAWSDLGQTRKSLLDDAGAVAAFERAVGLTPDDAVAQYRLGAEYLRLDRTPDALRHLEIAHRLNPEDQSAMNSLQLALRQSGQIEQADRIRHELAELLQKKDQARQNALMAIQLNNEGAELQKSGDLHGALQKYRQALDLYPEHTGIRANLAVALLRTGDWDRGIAQLQEAVRRNPDDAELRKALNDALEQAPRSHRP